LSTSAVDTYIHSLSHFWILSPPPPSNLPPPTTSTDACHPSPPTSLPASLPGVSPPASTLIPPLLLAPLAMGETFSITHAALTNLLHRYGAGIAHLLPQAGDFLPASFFPLVAIPVPDTSNYPSLLQPLPAVPPLHFSSAALIGSITTPSNLTLAPLLDSYPPPILSWLLPQNL
ncbi:hypothetical protein C0993_002747, partial [Termitomyces sp. T159_Od127]